MTGLVRVCASVATLSLFGACHSRADVSNRPTRPCRNAEQTLDRAIAVRDFASARLLRAATYAACGPRAELKAQDRRIIEGETSRDLAEADRARRERELSDALHAFLDFVAGLRAHPERASVRPMCDLPRYETSSVGAAAGPVASRPRFCVAKRSLGGAYPIEVRYDHDDPQAFRFTLGANGAVDCARVGGTREQSWQVPVPGGGTTLRERCALTGALAGLTAVVSASSPSSVHVVSQSYADRDPGARQALEEP